ncbi:protein regulator of cytokinesis 1-like isoform X2 [Acanthaster planci]|uniref:Protein regulator of cytokinesis 1-like isoform X2 n=1 Tax=Acanthaster planci TaxID=133434 RepID=A0A8B7XKW2_ACAPL|nr:protein regulator of cytokinesis 1-like isoform X2 [Acanthaster planci]
MSSKRCRESMKLEVAECLEHSLEQLRDIWDEIGICEEQRVERQNVVLHHMRNLLSEMVSEERDLRRRLLASVENCGQEVVTISKELGLQPFQPEEGLTILQLEKSLRQKVESLNKEKSERMAKLKQLKDREQHLCDLLCTTPYYIPSGTVPTTEQLETLKDHIQTLTTEKESRQQILSGTKKKIISLLADLEQGPNTSFERDIVCEEEDSFLLSKENMEALRVLHQELEFKQKENQGIADHLREQIASLWNRLLYPAEERDEYLASHQGYKPSDIKVLREEFARLEELKMQNLKRVTQASREEIALWWDKCYFSRQQRNEFAGFYDDEFTEELLLQHDEELARVKAYYEKNKEILECIKKREEMWKQMLEFEKRANDPNRYNNRGGNLLQEEKERKKINRDLPKLEKILAEQISSYEEKTGAPFLVDGCRFMDYVQMQWAAHEQEKQLRKEERIKAKHLQTENEMTFGSKPNTPAKRRNPNCSKTPNKRLKGLNGTSYAPSPRLGVTHSSIMPSPSPARRPPRACKATPSNNKTTTPHAAPAPCTYIPHIPFPSPSSIRRPPKSLQQKKTPKRVLRPTGARLAHRKALAERNADMSHAFSTSTISGGHHGPVNSNMSITSACSSYSDFAERLNQF